MNKFAEREIRAAEMGPEQWLIMVRCRYEKHQVELLEPFQGEGWSARCWWGEWVVSK